ncbi:MAG: DNA repair protein RecO [Burkholderiales bacterium]
MTAPERPQDQQPAYVLHSRPYRETSLIVEAFARDAGRVALVARGARRPRSAVRGLLMPFQPLTLSWFGKGELRTLRQAEWQGGQLPLTGPALMCGFYLNELLLRLLPRDDPHPALFGHYQTALQALGQRQPQAPVLRRFEKALLQELGYALVLEHEAHSDVPIAPDVLYVYQPEHGPVRRAAGEGGVQLRGRTLLDLARDDYSDPTTLAQAKQLMRMLIAHQLGGDALQTRQLLMDLQEL